MWAKIITIKITKDLNYFSLCALHLFNTRVSQFEFNYWNKLTFPRHFNLLRSTCKSVTFICKQVLIYIYFFNEFVCNLICNSLRNHHGLANPILLNPVLDWKGAVRMRAQTANKNLTINSQVIHTTPVHQLRSCEAKQFIITKPAVKRSSSAVISDQRVLDPSLNISLLIKTRLLFHTRQQEAGS